MTSPLTPRPLTSTATRPAERDDIGEFAELLESAPGQPAESAERVARRARARRARIVVAVVFALLAGSAGGYAAWALNTPLPAPDATTRTPTVDPGRVAALTMPTEGAAAIAVSGAPDYLGPGGISAASGDGSPRSIASISKLITALVILDAHPLAGADDPGPTITFSKADHDLYDEYYVLGATIAAMPTGSSMSLRDALATMLIPSASNYAEAVSTWAFGSPGGYVSAARSWLARHELTGTTIVDPTGLSPRNTSTPGDLLRIAALAAADPSIAAIAASESITIPAAGTLRNTNDLLGRGGVTGLKTGNLGEGTFALLFTATLDTPADEQLSVIGVSLDGDARDTVDASVLTMLESVRAGFHEVPLPGEGTVVGVYETAWGSTAELVVSHTDSILTWSDTPITATLDVSTPADYADGESVGALTWTAGPQTVVVPLEVKGTIEPPTDWWRLTHPSLLGDR